MTNKRKILWSAGLIVLVILAVAAARLIQNNRAQAGQITGSSDAPVVELVYANNQVTSREIADFSAYVEATDKPVFIDFWAEWCPPCRTAAPFVDSLAEQYDGAAHIVKVNVDEAQEIAREFGVQSIPLFVVMVQGEVVDHTIGFSVEMEGDLKAMIDRQLRP